MKNISNMLRNGNLTARERYLLIVQSDVKKSETGKATLTEADEKALENWRAKDSNEAREWNRLNEGWRYIGRMGLEAEFAYKDAQVAYLAQMPVIFELLAYQAKRFMRRYLQSLQDIKKVTIEEASRIATLQRDVKLNDGLDFDYATYRLAFELLGEGDRKRMNELYGDVETDHQYLDQEEIIANLFDDKPELSQEAKEKLAKLVAERSYNTYAREHQLFHYFACIPLLEVARHFLKKKGIEFTGAPAAKDQEAHEDEDIYDNVLKAMKTYAAEHKIAVEAMLEEACLEWLGNGLFDEYTPLVLCEGELLQRWFAAKAKAKAALLRHAESGELELERRPPMETEKSKLRSKDLFDSELESARRVFERVGLEIPHVGELDEKVAFEVFSDVVITGKSLYQFNGEYEFVRDFKKRVNEYEPNLGLVYAEDDPKHEGEHLDRELLICALDEKGEASFFGIHAMSVYALSKFHESGSFFKVAEEDGQTHLAFKDADMERIFLERRKMLVDGYAALLALEEVLKNASNIYEVNLATRVTGHALLVREYLEKHNEAIREATNTGEGLGKKKGRIFRQKEVLQVMEGWIVDIDNIKPDKKVLREHEAKLKDILQEF